MLKTNADGLKKALEQLVEQYKNKQEEMEKWKVRLTSLNKFPSTFSFSNRIRLAEEEQRPGRSATPVVGSGSALRVSRNARSLRE